LVLPVQNFIDDMELLRTSGSVLGLDEAVELLYSDAAMPPMPTVITFDDGFIEQFEVAFPVLRSLGLPATFFVVGSCSNDSGVVRWLDAFYALLDSCDGSEWSWQPAAIEHERLEFDTRSWRGVDAVKRVLRNAPEDVRHALIEELGEILRTKLDMRSLSSKLYMSSGHLRALAEAGMTIGAHSMSHADLSVLSTEEVRAELAESRDFVRSLTARDRISFAYPFGGPESYTPAVVESVRRAGFLCACTAIPGVNDSVTSRFELRRIDATRYRRSGPTF